MQNMVMSNRLLLKSYLKLAFPERLTMCELAEHLRVVLKLLTQPKWSVLRLN